MKNKLFEPKRNEVLIAVQSQINKIQRTQIIFIAVESLIFTGMISAIYFLIY